MAYFELLGHGSNVQLRCCIETGLGLKAHYLAILLVDDVGEALDFRGSGVLLVLQMWRNAVSQGCKCQDCLQQSLKWWDRQENFEKTNACQHCLHEQQM